MKDILSQVISRCETVAYRLRGSLMGEAWTRRDVDADILDKEVIPELAKLLAKPRLPWRKVGFLVPELGKDILARRTDDSIHSRRWAGLGFFNDETHWCYLDELRPEDAE